MSNLMTLTGTKTRALLFGMVVVAVTLAGCAMPVAPAAPAQPPAAAAPTSAPTAMTEMATATTAPTAMAEMATATMAPTAMTEMATATIAPAGVTAMVTLAKDDKLGEFLADEKGMTLYLFTKDTKDVSNCYDKCEAAWQVLFTDSAPLTGEGVDASLLGTTTRKDGKIQVTYNGWPLYYYVKDQKPGDVTGQEVGGVWYLISPKGAKIEAAMGEATAAPTAGAAQGETVKVAIKDFSYGAPLTVKAGTTVEWTNEDSAPHTVTDSNSAFESGNMDQGAAYSFTFDKAGTYDYICKYHSNMKGQVIVTP